MSASESHFGAVVEAYRAFPAELMGFLRSTYYACGFARVRPDPAAYWRELEARIVSAAGPGPFTFDFRIELLLATRP